MANFSHPELYGGEATLLQSNVFRIFAGEGVLHFGRVADRFWAETGKADKGRNFAEARYAETEPGDEEFLAVHKRNFSVRQGDGTKIELKKLSSMVAPHFRGILKITLATGKKRQLTLTGSMAPGEIETLIRKAFPQTEGTLGA